jgi:hypothetical protein
MQIVAAIHEAGQVKLYFQFYQIDLLIQFNISSCLVLIIYQL